jgi:drug/metabolite transporter (DMT)-like permease
MPTWAFLAIGAAVLTSFNPILYKRILREVDPIIVVWGVTFLALPLLGLFTFVVTLQFPGWDWLFIFGVLGSALLNAVAHLCSTQALKLADASLVTPLLIFSPVFTLLILALFLHEIPSIRGLLGVGLVLIGAYWLNRNSGAGWLTPFKALTLTPGVGLVLLAGLLWAITPLFEKTAIQHTYPESPRFAAFIVTMLLTFILTPVVIRRGKSAITKLSVNRRDLFLAGLIAGVAPVLGYTAFSLGPVGYVTTLFRLSTLMTVVWSFLFLDERGIAQRLPASFVMVVGAILITT